MERDACGIGFVANDRPRARRDIVELALHALERMAHRGAVSADGETGDGAGVLLPIPRELLADLLSIRGEPARIGTLMMFASKRRDADPLRRLTTRSADEEGLSICGWRPVPVDPTALGERAKATQPQILQAILRRPEHMASWEAERRAHRLRRRIEHQHRRGGRDVYVVSSSFATVTYKGLVTADRLPAFYPDLTHPDLAAGFAIFHQRFATNTAPTWERTQPFRLLCHNGEINTIDGNRHRMRGRQGSLGFADPADEDLFTPLIDPAGSDSASLDEVVELLTKEGGPQGQGRDIERVMAMLLPGAWEQDHDLDPEVHAFARWNATLTEAWDGPSGLVFTDGTKVGAALDRHGFRPLRLAMCEDGLVVCASEAGVIPLEGRGRVTRRRLGGGEVVIVDPARGGVELDPRPRLAGGLPYKSWASTHLDERPEGRPSPPAVTDLAALQVAHGFTREDIALVIKPSSATGEEPTFSMGDDTPLPPMRGHPRPVFDAIRQRFAQVTNPAIDHVRERTMMSLRVQLGRRAPLLSDGPEDVKLLAYPSFLADDVPLGHELDATWSIAEGVRGFTNALDGLIHDAVTAVVEGSEVVVLHQHAVGPLRAPIPSLLAVGAVNKALVVAGIRDHASIVVVADDVRHSHDAACLLAAGSEIIVPRLASAIVADVTEERSADAGVDEAIELALVRFRRALEGGVLKAMARLGISSIESYRGAEAFDVLGLGHDVVERVFLSATGPLGGMCLDELASDMLARHAAAFEAGDPKPANRGIVKFRRDGEHHATNPDVVRALHRVVDPGLARLRTTTAAGSPGAPATSVGNGSAPYDHFTRATEAGPPVSLRDLLRPIEPRTPVSLDDVEPAEAVLRRFSTGAMSQGAIGLEAHEALAIAMHMVGGRSNSGEGGEDRRRFRTARNCSIKQIASGRFGVTPEYLAFADELQIKIAQGSKPGEGGQLPGKKATAEIALLRHTQPGVALISPAPHHDIYSIEDLAQLIFDLRQANPAAEISVKLVAERGIGVIATGVVKAGADIVHVAGAEGGTGASPLISIKHVGMPWEMGLVEVHLALVDAGLRRGVRLRVDGGLRTGSDVMTASLLGADEFSFGTAALVALGCLMVRTCHLDTCPAGIATQRPEHRERFAGTPEMLAAYMRALAGDVRSRIASLGFTSLDEAIGRSDLLRPSRVASTLDLRSLLERAEPIRSHASVSVPASRQARRSERSPLGDRIHAEAWQSLTSGRSARLGAAITNTDRAVGAKLGAEIAREYGNDPPPGSTHVVFRGTAGQSFGAFLTDGITFSLEGEANDHVGKGMAGGTIAIRAPDDDAGDPCLAGNAALYGATGGELFIAGSVGDRFAVRNSGATAVVEGVGDHACEYMTGGCVLIVGALGRNLAAGMTGGCMMLVDPAATLDRRANLELVQIRAPTPEEMDRCHALLERHVELTGSGRVAAVLRRWSSGVEVRTVTPLGEPS